MRKYGLRGERLGRMLGSRGACVYKEGDVERSCAVHSCMMDGLFGDWKARVFVFVWNPSMAFWVRWACKMG